MTKESLGHPAKVFLDATHDVRQMRLGDGVVGLSALLAAAEQTAALHQAQVLGSHVAGDSARLGQLSDRVAVVTKQLHHAQPVRMGQYLETLGRFSQCSKRRECRRLGGSRFSCHDCSSFTQIYRNISTCQANRGSEVPQGELLRSLQEGRSSEGPGPLGQVEPAREFQSLATDIEVRRTSLFPEGACPEAADYAACESLRLGQRSRLGLNLRCPIKSSHHARRPWLIVAFLVFPLSVSARRVSLRSGSTPPRALVHNASFVARVLSAMAAGTHGLGFVCQ